MLSWIALVLQLFWGVYLGATAEPCFIQICVITECYKGTASFVCYTYCFTYISEKLEKEKGQILYRSEMESINSTLPSKQAQDSTLGMKLKRREIADERAGFTRRKSHHKMNQVNFV